MARTDNTEHTSFARRIIDSVWLKMGIFIVLFLILINLSMGGTSSEIDDRQAQFLSDAVRRAAVQSYALEGRFPENISYLEENYGLIIDHNRFAVYYESMGDNILPQIRVITLMRG